MKNTSIYANYVLDSLPVVLTQIDRDENSPTYGCCDRNHWHLKIRDFSSAILQQSGLALALASKIDFEGNIYYGNGQLLDWAKATLYYWMKIQLRDGSFNEYYPCEHGFPPTAFSLFSTCETYKILELSDDCLIKAMCKTGKYLVNHIETKAINQEIASITALYSLYSIVKENWIKEGIEKKLDIVLRTQSQEGWFPEYGGADIGYLSVSFDMLAEYYWQSKDERVLEPLERLTNFVQYFVHPDRTIGGEYGSRNTTYFQPNGLQVMINKGNRIADNIKQFLFTEYEYKKFYMNAVDDRYKSHYVIHSFLRAIQKEQEEIKREHIEKVELPCFRQHYKEFKEAGLITINNGNYFAVVSTQKGGIIKAYKGSEEIFCDFGYRIKEGKNKVSATNWLDPSYNIETNDNRIKVEGRFNAITYKIPSPILHMGLRGLSFIFGNKLISFLKKQIILVDKHSDSRFSREIVLDEHQIKIQDVLMTENDTLVKEASNMSLRHVASGKFFSYTDIKLKCLREFRVNKKVKIKKVYDFRTEKVDITSEEMQ